MPSILEKNTGNIEVNKPKNHTNDKKCALISEVNCLRVEKNADWVVSSKLN